MKKIIIFASGSGSNAEAIIEYFKNNNTINIVSIFTNKADAGVIERAKKHHIPCIVFTKKDFQEPVFLEKIIPYQADLIVLAGFLLKVPDYFVQHFNQKIINIHPSLLPKYGGNGMYGINVHRAVWEHSEKESGITIHYVNEHYDQGNIILQDKINIQDCSSPEEIAQKILALEHQNLPKVIERLLSE
ncbi:MAG: phosphoribosylglycinamide formyltransferase [Bacteroidota bacterium]|nr:phosphoribosylglycinamide formyltransferase [Bacteroidota bacterium]